MASTYANFDFLVATDIPNIHTYPVILCEINIVTKFTCLFAAFSFVFSAFLPFPGIFTRWKEINEQTLEEAS